MTEPDLKPCKCGRIPAVFIPTDIPFNAVRVECRCCQIMATDRTAAGAIALFNHQIDHPHDGVMSQESRAELIDLIIRNDLRMARDRELTKMREELASRIEADNTQ